MSTIQAIFKSLQTLKKSIPKYYTPEYVISSTIWFRLAIVLNHSLWGNKSPPLDIKKKQQKNPTTFENNNKAKSGKLSQREITVNKYRKDSL